MRKRGLARLATYQMSHGVKMADSGCLCYSKMVHVNSIPGWVVLLD